MREHIIIKCYFQSFNFLLNVLPSRKTYRELQCNVKDLPKCVEKKIDFFWKFDNFPIFYLHFYRTCGTIKRLMAYLQIAVQFAGQTIV